MYHFVTMLRQAARMDIYEQAKLGKGCFFGGGLGGMPKIHKVGLRNSQPDQIQFEKFDLTLDRCLRDNLHHFVAKSVASLQHVFLFFRLHRPASFLAWAFGRIYFFYTQQNRLGRWRSWKSSSRSLCMHTIIDHIWILRSIRLKVAIWRCRSRYMGAAWCCWHGEGVNGYVEWWWIIWLMVSML